ncbi:MAG: hypothetical protein WC718_07125 [Phycisphaerales bacterium]|jgi:hypothetical protein
MAVTAKAAVYGWPKTLDYQLQRASATAVINVGDPLIYSGSFVLAAAITAPEEKASAAGLALESNPQYDSFGNVVTASALLYAVGGIFRVSGASGAAAWTLGQSVYPSATGSGVAAPTGKTGIGALWAQAAKQLIATAGVAPTGAAIIHASGIATIVNFVAKGANSAELDILLMPARPDYV